jgi:Nif-specific regulatory protein
MYELEPGRKYLLGRAETNEVVIDDDLCSRYHAELYRNPAGQWMVRDCGSRNGTKVNGEVIENDQLLRSGDEVSIGRSRLVYTTQLTDLTPSDTPSVPEAGHDIVSRVLMSTRYDNGETMLPPPSSDESKTSTRQEGVLHQKLAKDLAFLFRLALDMGQAAQFDELKAIVLKALLDATNADGAAMLSQSAQGTRKEWRVVGFQTPAGREHAILTPPINVVKEVQATRQAVLAVARNRFQIKPGDESKTLASFVLAPVKDHDNIEHLLYVYCATPLHVLQQESLELCVAICKQLAVALRGVKRQDELVQENQRLRAQVALEVQLIGTSASIEAIMAQIGKVARTTATVLVRGESGVGKELVARAIHLASPRRAAPFVCLNCAALPETLLESELFGHEKGAFTGATERKIGKFEAAHGGTIFLDEIGEMPQNAQSKLLRVLEGHAYERVGGAEPVKVNVRVVAATNRPLEEAVRSGKFRPDLYYRLQVVEIRVPPLRERREDIPLLADFFLARFKQEIGRKVTGFTQAAMQKLMQHSWPGNVRELRNVVERAVALSDGNIMDVDDLWLAPLSAPGMGSGEGPKLKTDFRPITLEAMEKEHIHGTLRFVNWVKSQAATLLGIERSTLDRKIRAYDINKDPTNEQKALSS